MRQIKVNTTIKGITVGRRAENESTQVVIDVSGLVTTYGDGSAVLMVKRARDTEAYPATVSRVDDTVVWVPTATDLAYAGTGEAELFWYVGETLAKTVVWRLSVQRDIGPTTSESPAPYEGWVQSLTGLGAESLENARRAETAAEAAEEAVSGVAHMTATATTLPTGSEATASYEDGLLTLGIPTGPAGPQGERGERGERGPAGEMGPAGPRGETGSAGPAGPQGERGLTGEAGPAGPAGPKGDTGSTGPAGPQGERGLTGETGPAGVGVPTGGVAGQVLAKASGTNYDTEWVNASGGLAPLIGTTATVTPQQVMTALGEGRDVCITATTTFQSIPLELKFTAFNRATDTLTGQAMDVVISQTLTPFGVDTYLFELFGGTMDGAPVAWTVLQEQIAKQSDITVTSVNGQTGNVSIDYSNVGAVPNSWGTSDAGKFLVVGPNGYVTTQTLESADTTSY